MASPGAVLSSDVTAGIQGLARRFELPPDAPDQLDRLLDLLATDPLAPTAVREPAHILKDHLADSLVALEFEALHSTKRIADVGSGAGLPGLALAIALPAVQFALVESSTRKCEFIARAAAECGVLNVEVVDSRVEEWGAGRAASDAVLARALAPLEVVLEYGAPLLGVGGHLIVWRGRRDSDAEARATRAADLLGLSIDEIRRVWPYDGALDRHLYLLSKVMDTPSQFPRRPGMASKRPLGAGYQESARPDASSGG